MNITDSYTLKLVDQILAPLKNIEKQAEKVNETLSRMEQLTSKGAGFAKLAAGIGVAVGGFLALKSAGHVALSVLERVADATVHFGKLVIETSRFNQMNKGALDLFLGKGKGESSFQRVLQFGNVLPMSEIALVDQFTSLASAGYKGHQLDAVNAALADVFALRGERYRSNLEFHFLRLKNEAKPDARDVKMAAIDTGVGMEGVMRHLFSLKGIKNAPKDIFKMEEMYEQMKKEGKVTGNDVANAILHAINERLDEGKGLGSMAKKMGAGTLAGLLSNLEAAPQRFLAQIGVEKFSGVQSLMKFIERVLEFFKLGTPQGERLAKVVERLVNNLFGGLDNLDDKALEELFTRGVAMAEQFGRAVLAVWEAFGPMMGLITATADFISIVWGLGSAFVDGLLSGAGPGVTLLITAVQELFGQLSGGSVIMQIVNALFHGMGEFVGLAVGGIAGLAAGVVHLISLLGDLWNWLVKVTEKLGIVAGLRSAWQGAQGAGASIVSGVEGAWQGAQGAGASIVSGVEGAWQGAQGTGASIVSGVEGAWQGAQGTGASIVQGFGDAWRGMTNSVPHMAEGGLVTEPTLALIGEAGPEIVMPVGALGGGAPAPVYNITVNVTAGGDDDVERAQAFGAALRTELVEVLREAGLRTGARVF